MAATVKVDFEGEIQRLPVAAPVSFQAILERVRATWPEPLAAGAALKYEDEEGDLCTLTVATMEDLLLLQPPKGPQHVLRLKLVRPGGRARALAPARPAPAAVSPAAAPAPPAPVATTSPVPEQAQEEASAPTESVRAPAVAAEPAQEVAAPAESTQLPAALAEPAQEDVVVAPVEASQAATPAAEPEPLRPVPEPSAPPLPDNDAESLAGVVVIPAPSAPPLPQQPAPQAQQAPPAQPQQAAPPPQPRRPRGAHTRFPIQIEQTHVVVSGGSPVDVNVRFSIWSVWPEGFGVAGCCWQADVSPWIPSAELDIQLPADADVRNMWSAEVLRKGANGVLKIRLAPWPTTCFGGNLGLRGDPGTCAERLVDALEGC